MAGNNVMTFAKLREQETQHRRQSEQEKNCTNKDPMELTSDDVCKLVSENFSELTAEQREKYHRNIKKETINGKMLLKIGSKRVDFDEIANKIGLNLCHKIEFEELIDKIQNKQKSDTVDTSTSEIPNKEQGNSENLSAPVQHINTAGCVIGVQTNRATNQTNNTNCKIYKDKEN